MVAASPGFTGIDDNGRALADFSAATKTSGRGLLKRRALFGEDRRLVGMAAVSTPEGEFMLALIGPAERPEAAAPVPPAGHQRNRPDERVDAHVEQHAKLDDLRNAEVGRVREQQHAEHRRRQVADAGDEAQDGSKPNRRRVPGIRKTLSRRRPAPQPLTIERRHGAAFCARLASTGTRPRAARG
jgi:hypothetical protein